jgi:hypothetical protein
MKNVEGKNKYLNAALHIYEENIKSTNSPIKLARSYIARARIYVIIGNFNQSIEEYLKASGFASSAKIRNEIETGVGHVFSLCQPHNKRNRKRVPWKEVQSMALSPDRSRAGWCQLSAEKLCN